MYDSRYVHLLTIGGILIYVGLVNAGLNWRLKLGDRLAPGVATVTSLSLMLYLALFCPFRMGVVQQRVS